MATRAEQIMTEIFNEDRHPSRRKSDNQPWHYEVRNQINVCIEPGSVPESGELHVHVHEHVPTDVDDSTSSE